MGAPAQGETTDRSSNVDVERVAQLADGPPPDWRLRDLLGGLLARVGAPLRLPQWPGRLLIGRGTLSLGPDGTVIVMGGRVPRHAGGWTHGNWIILRRYDPPLSATRSRALLNHEYVHVLQYRADGMLRFYWRYLCSLLASLWRRRSVWDISPYERVGVDVEVLYLRHPELPDLWDLPGAAGQPPGSA